MRSAMAGARHGDDDGAAAAAVRRAFQSTSMARSASVEDAESSPASSDSPLTPPNVLTAQAAHQPLQQHHHHQQRSLEHPSSRAPSSLRSEQLPPLLLPEAATSGHVKNKSGLLHKLDTMNTNAPPSPGLLGKSSKKDIFNAPSPVLTPAPKLPSLRPSLPSSLQHSPAPGSPLVLPSLPSLPSARPSLPVAIEPEASGATAYAQSGKPPTLRISTDSSSSAKSSSADSFWQPAPGRPPGWVPRSDESSSSYDDDPVRRHHAEAPVPGRARTPPASNPDIRIRLILSAQYLLGVGSHSDVYLGSYRFRSQPTRRRDDDAEGRSHGSSRPRRWHLCAIKRLHPDRESLLLGLDEVFVLRRLGPHPNVVRLIDVRDEVDLVPERGAGGTQLLSTRFLAGRRFHSPSSGGEAGRRTGDQLKEKPLSAVSRPQPRTPLDERVVSLSASSPNPPAEMRSLKGDAQAQEASTGTGPSPDASQRASSTFLAALSYQGRTQHGHSGGHARSTSDTYGDRSPTPPRSSAGHNRAAEGRLAAPPSTSHGVANADQHVASALPGSTSNPDPPRMLLLLELLPHQLSTYARLHPHRVTYDQWRRWAIDLVSVLAFFHARNLAHADIKKENCMLTDDLVLKVGDLGSARWIESGGGSGGGGAVGGGGTLAYSAPELTRAGMGSNFGPRGSEVRSGSKGDTGGGESQVGVKIDIWSAGAVLYSLAIDQPPFARARSTIDILSRKRNFFQTEEADRISRFDVEVGMSSIASMSSRPGSRMSTAGDSGTPSRHGSLRGRHSRVSSENLLNNAVSPGSVPNAWLGSTGTTGGGASMDAKQVQMSVLGLGMPSSSSAASISNSFGAGQALHPQQSPLVRRGTHTSTRRERERDSSADSVDSLASSIQNMDGRSPSAMAVAALLADDGALEEGEVEDAEGEDSDLSKQDGEGRSTSGAPPPYGSSLGLLAPAGAGLGDSSPLRKGTAALLSHSHARRAQGGGGGGMPTSAVSQQVATAAASGGTTPSSSSSLVSVRRTPSMPFRPSAGHAGVSRHHSVKVQSGLGHGHGPGQGGGHGYGGGGGGDAWSPSGSVAALGVGGGRKNRMRAISVSGHTTGLHAPVPSGPPPLFREDGLEPAYRAYGGAYMGGPQHGSSDYASSASTSTRQFEDELGYCPPTPIAEASEAESEGTRWGRASTVGEVSASASATSVVGEVNAGVVGPGPAAGSSRLGLSPPLGERSTARMQPSYESLSAASTAGSSPPRGHASGRARGARGPDDGGRGPDGPDPTDDDQDHEHEHDREGEDGEEDEDEEEEEEDARPYPDGSPPILLPGGGRLPDAARELLRAMLETDPRRRPSAVEVLGVLREQL